MSVSVTREPDQVHQLFFCIGFGVFVALLVVRIPSGWALAFVVPSYARENLVNLTIF